MSETTDRFRDQVARNAEGTPYVVTPTAEGFDVGIDIVDARWFELYRKVGLSRTFVHHVAVDGTTYTVTDDSRTLEWEAGSPRLGATLERFVGRKYEFSFQKTIAITEEARLDTVVNYTFSSEEGRKLIKRAAREQGLEEHLPTSAKWALWFAIAVLAVMAVLFPLAYVLGWF
jgi:hypothetical protein